MAKKSIGISLQIPAELNLTQAEADALGEAVKVKLAAIQPKGMAQNLLSLPETNIFLRRPRQPQAASSKKKSSAKR